MKLSEAIVQAHCRKGKAVGTTKNGAYWLACGAIHLRDFGGDGIGQSAPDQTMWLELRHYRDGVTRAVIEYNARHQDYRLNDRQYAHVNDILDCETVEQVIVVLKGKRVNDHAVYSDGMESTLTNALTSLGMIASEPPPDEGRE